MPLRLRYLPLILAAFSSRLPAAPIVPYVVEEKLVGRLRPAEPSQVHVSGWLGKRIDANLSQRLTVIETAPMLAGYLKRPGEHPWIGEHVGKWLHAATLAWDYSRDAALRAKLDDVARQLISAQEADGYLGTYEPEKRLGIFPNADWDVWSHKYNLIGLLTHHRYTGAPDSLLACRRIADLMIATFPAKKSILAAGTHVGMAATSILEPMVELYRVTGDPRYLDFAKVILRAYDEPGGPALVRSLLSSGRVDLTANGKAYEMLSNLVGVLALARVTGEQDLVRAVQAAWSDITAKRLYVTGTTSVFELFPRDYELPNGEDSHIGETCVTTTWIQLNRGLLALTGEARYANEIERSLYNQLAAAQHPRGDDWCYYTALEGVKHYDKGITCCHSSGPRGMALAPTVAFLTSSDTVYVNTFESATADLKVNGVDVHLEQKSEFPYSGRSTLRISAPSGSRFRIAVRSAEWAQPVRIEGANLDGGWLVLPARVWSTETTIPISFKLQGRVLKGQYTNYSRTACLWGPFVLAIEGNPKERWDTIASYRLLADQPLQLRQPDLLEIEALARGPWDAEPRRITLVPFAEAGADGEEYRVWLRTF
ncbi:glycoside hydrolase family 127 protein [Nibricoccus sp. IMCC34717]|uniref:glycoside hydrolase family 127 protein n=1 Tax=Nibricoccus sp. IMCC34717 TaxID=3034021 RepID=UPI00384F49DC